MVYASAPAVAKLAIKQFEQWQKQKASVFLNTMSSGIWCDDQQRQQLKLLFVRMEKYVYSFPYTQLTTCPFVHIFFILQWHYV